MHRLARLGRYEALLVIVVGERFGAGEERGATLDAIGAERERSDQAAAIRDPAGSHDRDAQLARHLRQQNIKWQMRAHVTTGFDALQDDDIRTGRFREQRILERADLVQDQASRFLSLRDDLGIDIPEEAHRRHPRVEADRKLFAQQLGIGRERNEVDPERVGGAASHLGDLACDQIRRFAHHAQQSEPACFRHRGCQLRSRRPAHAG